MAKPTGRRKKFKNEWRKGSKCVEALKQKWNVGKKYEFKVCYNKIDVAVLKEQNDNLRGEKRKLEETLVEEEAKRLRVEEKLSKAINKAQQSSNFYKKEFKRIARKLAKQYKTKKGRGPNKNAKFDQYSTQHQARVKQKIKGDCLATLGFLGMYNFVATKVEIFNTDTNKYETLSLIDEDDLPLADSEAKGKELTDDDLDDLNMWIYLKDKFNVSN